MELQVIKNKLHDVVDMIIEANEGSPKEDIFVVYNGVGGVIKELTCEEANAAIDNCKSIEELENLFLEEWLYKDEYASLEDLLYTTMGEYIYSCN